MAPPMIAVSIVAGYAASNKPINVTPSHDNNLYDTRLPWRAKMLYFRGI